MTKRSPQAAKLELFIEREREIGVRIDDMITENRRGYAYQMRGRIEAGMSAKNPRVRTETGMTLRAT